MVAVTTGNSARHDTAILAWALKSGRLGPDFGYGTGPKIQDFPRSKPAYEQP